jgi:hypothetical protein
LRTSVIMNDEGSRKSAWPNYPEQVSVIKVRS